MVVSSAVSDERGAGEARARRSALLDEAEQEAGHGQDREDDEQDLGDAHGAGGNATKTEQGSDQRDDEEDDGVVQHGENSWRVGRCLEFAGAAAPWR